MPEYLHPGVYIEEQPAPQSIEGVSTSTAGFVGVTQKGPTSGLPQLVTSFADFTRKYGSYLPEDPWGDARYLAYAVEGFFNNGGRRLYVQRVVGDGAAPASLTLRDGFVTRLTEDTSATPTARNVVKLASLRGISVGSELAFQETIAGVLANETRTVIAYDTATNTVTLDTPLDARFTRAGATISLSGVADAPLPAAGNPRLRVDAISPGEWGRSLQVSVSESRSAVGLTQAFATTAQTTLTARELAFGDDGPPAIGATSVVLESAAGLAQGDVIEFEVGGQTERRTLTTIDANTVNWAGGLERAYTGGQVRLISVLRSGATNPTVSVASAAGIAVGDLVRISEGTNTQVLLVSATGANTLTLDTAAFPIAKTYNAGASLVVGNAGNNGTAALNMRSARNFYPGAVIEIDNGTTRTYHTVANIAGNVLTLAANLAQAVPSGTAVRVVEFSLTLTDTISGVSERFDNLSMNNTLDNYVETVVNPRSNLARVTAIDSTRPIPFNLPSTLDGAVSFLMGGSDGDVPGADDYIGVDNGPGARTGIKALADIDAVSIIAAPGVSLSAVQAELISQCENLKDRFAVLDPAPGSVIGSGSENDVIVQRSNFDTQYAAFYYPWLRVLDPLDPDRKDGAIVPPSGHVIGIYARVDVERGVQKAPANEVVRGAIGVEVKLNDSEQDILNPAPNNINVIRDFRSTGRGIRVWGARVITSDNAWKYIPVRRLFIFLEESLDQGLQWAVFEPNGEDLWARVRQAIIGFLRTIWLNGGLAGVTEDEAFFVRADRSTMTEDDIANGRLIVLVGVAPLRPAEFVIIRIGQKTLEAAE